MKPIESNKNVKDFSEKRTRRNMAKIHGLKEELGILIIQNLRTGIMGRDLTLTVLSI